MKVSLINR